MLARIPFALAKMHQTVGRVLVAHALVQLGRQRTLGRAQCRGVPFGAIGVVHRHEGGFAAHGQAHVAGLQVDIDLLAQRHDGLPFAIAVRLGDPRRFPDSLDRHDMGKLGLARLDQTTDGRRRSRIWAAGKRNMALASEQARGGIEAHPAGTRQIHLTPGVQVGKVDVGTRGAVQRLLVGRELDQVTRNKARSHAQVAQQLHQQPGRVAA